MHHRLWHCRCRIELDAPVPVELDRSGHAVERLAAGRHSVPSDSD